MREPHLQLYVHFVLATSDRQPLIVDAVRKNLYACLRSECPKLNLELLAIGGVEDHIHLLAKIPASLSVAEIVKQLKGSSSQFVNHATRGEKVFKWQGTYAAFSVAKAAIPACRNYIQNQEYHHRLRTTQADLELP